MPAELNIAGQLSGRLKNIKNVSGNLSINGGTATIIHAGSGTNDYDELSNKPSINGITVEGAKTSQDYKIYDEAQELNMQEIDDIIFGGN